MDWYPWGEEAFAAARKADRPVFLSVGYSTCHWCHVMEHESFEDAGLAALLNRDYIAIKVDREERPDVDALYMGYTQAATGRGGWPMSVWLTPDRQPFFAGTYFPPADFRGVLSRLADLWVHDRTRITEAAGDAGRMLAGTHESAPAALPPNRALLRAACDAGLASLQRSFDRDHGGFGGEPKFPRPVTLSFLLRYDRAFGSSGAREMVLSTLRHMAAGGMHDQLGGGFHRYAVDDHWHVPHFEKMLYDQAQLAAAYLEGWQLTRDPLFEQTLRDTLEYCLRDMGPAEGGFRSAEDADSAEDAVHPAEKREGAFYVWTREELDRVLGEADGELFAAAYGVEPAGNAEHDPQGELAGRNVLFRALSDAELAAKFKVTVPVVAGRLAHARTLLLAARGKRPRPHLDDKVLASWNGLLLGALARVGAALGEPRYLEAARQAASFVFNRLTRHPDGRLLRRWRDGDAAIGGMLDDHANMVGGLLDLYEATGEWKWLAGALKLQERQEELFADPRGGYWTTGAGDDPLLLARAKDDYDGAEPAGNSVAALNLVRLAALTGRASFREAADRHLAWSVSRMGSSVYAQPLLLAAACLTLTRHRQLILAGPPEAPATLALRRAAAGRFLPEIAVISADGGAGQAALAETFAVLHDIHPPDGRPAAFLCVDRTCDLPVTDPAKLEALLDK